MAHLSGYAALCVGLVAVLAVPGVVLAQTAFLEVTRNVTCARVRLPNNPPFARSHRPKP